MKQYVAKYYPLDNGKEKEYVTTVCADSKTEAESLIRQTFIQRLERVQYLATQMNAVFIGTNVKEVPKNIEYAKHKMRVVIMEQ